MKFIVQSGTTENLLTTHKRNYLKQKKKENSEYIEYHKLSRLLFSCKKKKSRKKPQKINNRTQYSKWQWNQTHKFVEFEKIK